LVYDIDIVKIPPHPPLPLLQHNPHPTPTSFFKEFYEPSSSLCVKKQYGLN